MHAALLSTSSMDRFFAALADGHRHVLSLTARRPGGTDGEDLVRSFADLERNGGTAPRAASARPVAVSLRHVHLPTLSAAGVVESDGGTVTRRSLAGGLESLVATAAGIGREARPK